jgi:hypothetical protein
MLFELCRILALYHLVPSSSYAYIHYASSLFYQSILAKNPIYSIYTRSLVMSRPIFILFITILFTFSCQSYKIEIVE